MVTEDIHLSQINFKHAMEIYKKVLYNDNQYKKGTGVTL